MDKNFYYEKMAQQRQSEISQMLAQHQNNRHEPLSRKQAQRLVLRIAFAVIASSALIAILL